MKGAALQQYTQQMLGHRQDENCNLNRKALMIEKANRLGDQMTKKAVADDGNIQAFQMNQGIKSMR